MRYQAAGATQPDAGDRATILARARLPGTRRAGSRARVRLALIAIALVGMLAVTIIDMPRWQAVAAPDPLWG